MGGVGVSAAGVSAMDGMVWWSDWLPFQYDYDYGMGCELRVGEDGSRIVLLAARGGGWTMLTIS